MPNLSRTEAVARAALLDVDAYEIDLDLSRVADRDVFVSASTIRFRCAEPGADTFVQVSAETIEEVRLNGRSLDPAGYADGRFPLTDLRGDNELYLRATIRYSTDGEGLHRFTDPADGEIYLYAMAGPANADRIFAGFDQPDLKARIRLSVTAPAQWMVWGNGTGVTPRPGRFEFTATEPISTYLMTVVAGPYHTVHDEHDGIPLALAARRSLAADLDENAAEIFTLTKAAFDWYHRVFGIRYPFGNYFQAFVPEFEWGAVENPGCVTFSERSLFRGEATETERELRAVVIAHEMAHMWFGDLVTLRWWEDIWLNEAFAEYMGWRVAVETSRFTDAWTSFAVARKAWGYAADQRPSTHPVAPEDVRDAADALANFDGISYAKGASVLRQLNAWLGDAHFFAGLRAYFTAHAFGNATLADLLRHLAEASGRDLRAWAGDWLRQPQVNTLRPEVSYGPDGVASLSIVQTAAAEYPVLRSHRLDVAVYDGASIGFRAEIEVSGERTEVPGIAGTAPGVVLVNDGDLGYAKIRFDARGRKLLPKSLPRITDPLARALVWSAAADATRDAEWSADEYLALVAAALPTETAGAFTNVLGFAQSTVIDRFLPEARRPEAVTGIVDICETVLNNPGDIRQLDAARALIAATGPDNAERLSQWLNGNGIPDGLTVDNDLRWRIIVRLAVLGIATEDLIAAEAVRDPSSPGVGYAAEARAALPDPAAKAEAWRTIIFDTDRPARIIAATAKGFWQPGQTELTAPYVERFFDEYPDTAASRGQMAAHRITLASFPAHAIADSTVELAERTLARADLDTALRRDLADATDELRRCLAARALG